MSEVADFKPGLEGVVAVETEIAEPDREGGALRYRGVDIEELVGHVPYEKVWGLLVDESLEPGMPEPDPYEPPCLTGNAPADAQAEIARLSGVWSLGKVTEISDEQARDDLGRLSAQVMSIVARSARVADGHDGLRRRRRRRGGKTAAERFLLRWRGEADPRHVTAIDTYWICTAEHGLNASTFTARVAASTGADAGAAMSAAIGTLSGPLHGGAPAHVIPMIDEVAAMGDATGYVDDLLSARRPHHGLRAPRLPRGGPACPAARADRRGARLRPGSRRRARSSRPRSWPCRRAIPIACSRRTSSTGRRSCSTSRTSPRS